jgi:curved DNA-binding protein CbpA
VRINLDYYRILGIPIQANDELLLQAYQDRSRQMPRREYSQLAIASRQQLLDQAYHVLSNYPRRERYDREFLEKAYGVLDSLETALPIKNQSEGESSPESLSPWIEIETEELVGALLLLEELGEYEQAIRLGAATLKRPFPDAQTLKTKPDIILTLALAYLELSREYWQDKQYDNASRSAEKGIDILTENGGNFSFSHLSQELWSNYYKLRPYRILELLSLDLEEPSRNKAFQLLDEMLDERGGLNGKGDDRSGLGVDDFLRFIQQIRQYLTVEEQEKLFTKESQRSSIVANYLRVYALIAKGFSQKEPGAILEANDLLRRLRKHQDVCIEQSICALLLGQTDLATITIKESKDQEILNYIQEESESSPDLLPGLCNYGETWLQSEVFSDFRDLADQQAHLGDYFAAPIVQKYLESQADNIEKFSGSREEITSNQLESEITLVSTPSELYYPMPLTGALSMRESALPYSTDHHQRPGSEIALSYPSINTQTRGNVAIQANQPDPQPRRRRRPDRVRTPQASAPQRVDKQAAPVLNETARKVRGSRKRSLRVDRVLLLGAAFLGSLTLCGWGIKTIVDNIQSPLLALSGEQLSIELSQPPLEIPAAKAEVATAATLNSASAREVVQTWLDNKSAALGADHQVDKLKEILTQPALSLWLGRANNLKETNSHWTYQHQLDIKSVTNEGKERGTITALVNEQAKYFENGKQTSNRSYDDSLKVRYDVIRKGDQWLIKDIKVIQ